MYIYIYIRIHISSYNIIYIYIQYSQDHNFALIDSRSPVGHHPGPSEKLVFFVMAGFAHHSENDENSMPRLWSTTFNFMESFTHNCLGIGEN